jgi:hypothetical protein
MASPRCRKLKWFVAAVYGLLALAGSGIHPQSCGDLHSHSCPHHHAHSSDAARELATASSSLGRQHDDERCIICHYLAQGQMVLGGAEAPDLLPMFWRAATSSPRTAVQDLTAYQARAPPKASAGFSACFG